MRISLHGGVLLALLVGCPTAAPPPGPPEGDDDTTTAWEAAWDRGQAPTSEVSLPRGLQAARSITHLHSPHSHDACDGDPQPEGLPNEPCHDDLREALCTTRIDVAFLSDHPAHFAEASWGEDILLLRPEDEPLDPEGMPSEAEAAVAKRFACEDGHEVLWLPGVEDELMPLGLERHAGEDLDAAGRDALYNRTDPETATALREAGALVFQAHTESRSSAELAALGLDGIEIYNLHANVDPNIREEFLGLERLGFASAAGPFIADAELSELEPDLLFLAFFEPSGPALATWDALLATQRVVGIAGTDAHQNVLNLPLADGERVDSYRRMLRWFSNLVLLPKGPLTPQTVKEGLGRGRSWVAFEALGTPTDLDFHVALPDGTIVELGGEAAFQAGSTIHLARPDFVHGPPRDHELAPELTLSILRVGEGEPVVVATGEESLELSLDAPGVYRAEVWITPNHLSPLLPGQEALVRPLPWLYANPIYLR